MNQNVLIRNSEFNIGKADNSTLNIQNSALPTASIRDKFHGQFTIICVSLSPQHII